MVILCKCPCLTLIEQNWNTKCFVKQFIWYLLLLRCVCNIGDGCPITGLALLHLISIPPLSVKVVPSNLNSDTCLSSVLSKD
jgi:hypothetical protein